MSSEVSNTDEPSRPARRKGKTAPANGGAGKSRRDEIIEIAAECFGTHGYDATTMRDIAKEAGIFAGSIYYHFESKADILIAVHKEAVRRITERVEAAIDRSADHWTQLEQAAAAYAVSLVTERRFAQVVVSEFPRHREGALRKTLVSHRDRFEQQFRDIIDQLPLQPWVNRSLWRLALLSQLAWMVVWYHEGAMSPEKIAQQMVDLLRRETGT